MRSAFDLAPTILSKLSPAAAVEAFRDLLWAEGRSSGIDPTKVHLSLRTDVKDGGVDVSIDHDAAPRIAAPLLSAGTRYQIKTGNATKPWQRKWIDRELFGAGKPPRLENLAHSVRRCMEERGRYVLVCFGADPTPDEQLVTARQNLVDAFTECGFDDPNAEVWGQTHLIGLMARYPSLCLRIAGRDDWAMQSHSSWALAAETQGVVYFKEAQVQMLDSIRSFLRTDDRRQLRLIGEPGVGKSRLAFEATSAPDIAPLTLYIPAGEEFQRGSLFNTLLRPDNDFRVVLVIDECTPTDRASIWNHLRNRSDRIRLITIDHGPEQVVSGDTVVVTVPPLTDEPIREIISEYAPAFEAYRWAEFCQGSPRVAHVVGRNSRTTQPIY